LEKDIETVRNALAVPWSNGPTEGHVNRLKVIKRQMYGRAKFDLLRKRVLQVC
jgi:transposase